MKSWMSLINGYMICTCLAIILSGQSQELAMLMYAVGGSSGYIAFGEFCAAELGIIGGLCALLWMCAFPVGLIITYILAKKGSYVPFWIFMLVDACIVIVWGIYAITKGNIYGFTTFILDFILGVAYIVIIITRIIWKLRRKVE